MESLRGLSSSPASAYDELVTGQKSIRYHWQGILSVIRALPAAGWASAWKARAASSRNRAPPSTCSTIAARRAGRSIRCPSSSRPTNGPRSRPVSIQRARLLDAVLADLYGPQTLLARAPAAADAGPRQPAFPAALPGHRRHGADAPSRPVRRRPGAAGRRPLARAGRPHRGAVRHRLCARDAPRAGAQPARGVPLDPGAPSPAVRRPLAQFAARHGAGRRAQPQHGAC